MRWRWCSPTRRFVAAVLGLAAAGAAGALPAEPIEVELEMVVQRTPGQIAIGEGAIHRRPSTQSFFHQIGGPEIRVREPGRRDFSEVVQREPRYQAEQPIRQVARLGGQDFAFVLDKKEKDAQRYEVLYFDRNGNGDLTDDEPIEASVQDAMFAGDYWSFSFPPIDLELSVEGTRYPYRVAVSAYSYSSRVVTGSGQVDTTRSMNVSLAAAAHREGTATVNGAERRFLLLDQNSDGRFDSFGEIVSARMASGEERWSLRSADRLLVDPDPADPRQRMGHDVTVAPGQHHLSPLVHLDEAFYEVAVTPAGDRMTLTPSTRPIGQLSGAAEEFTAVFFGDQGVVTVQGGPDRPVRLPAGEWRLLNYTIDLTGREEPAAEEAEKEERGSLLSLLARSLAGAAPQPDRGRQFTILSAAARGGEEPVEVVAGEVAELSLGPPLKAVAQLAPYTRREGTVELELAFIGAGGERVTNLMVAGGRPPAPTFEILDPDDEVVASGQFEYG